MAGVAGKYRHSLDRCLTTCLHARIRRADGARNIWNPHMQIQLVELFELASPFWVMCWDPLSCDQLAAAAASRLRQRALAEARAADPREDAGRALALPQRLYHGIADGPRDHDAAGDHADRQRRPGDRAGAVTS